MTRRAWAGSATVHKTGSGYKGLDIGSGHKGLDVISAFNCLKTVCSVFLTPHPLL